MFVKHLVALACLPLALSACGTVSAHEVQLSPPPTGLCATAQAQALVDDLGAVYSDSPSEAAEEFARTGGAGPLPTKGWAAYERQGDSVMLAAEDWRLRASRNPDKGWLIVESHICG
jgi:hypothetical protein